MAERRSFRRQARESSKVFSTSAKRQEVKEQRIGRPDQHILRGGHVAERIRNWQPMNDGVLIERLEPIDQGQGVIKAPDGVKHEGMILRRGRVLAVGPGKWHLGEWWKLKSNLFPDMRSWQWIPGWRETLEVKPGDLVIFNARWNDFSDACNRGSGADGRGPMERPLSYRFNPNVHLVQEADIAGVLHG